MIFPSVLKVGVVTLTSDQRTANVNISSSANNDVIYKLDW